MAVLKPARLSTCIMRPTPSVMGRFSAISRITLSSSPLSRATRSRKLSQKSISPRMARSVMALTLSPTPARIASSSMTSVSISVESISKHTRRRQRRNTLSCWREMSNSFSLDIFMKCSCMAATSCGVPRTENSTQLLERGCSSSFSGMRPVRRCMPSMFSPCAAISAVTSAMCLALRRRPRVVMIQRFLPCRATHSSYSATVMGVKRIFTLRS